jgi:hypothetical protein
VPLRPSALVADRALVQQRIHQSHGRHAPVLLTACPANGGEEPKSAFGSVLPPGSRVVALALNNEIPLKGVRYV